MGRGDFRTSAPICEIAKGEPGKKEEKEKSLTLQRLIHPVNRSCCPAVRSLGSCLSGVPVSFFFNEQAALTQNDAFRSLKAQPGTPNKRVLVANVDIAIFAKQKSARPDVPPTDNGDPSRLGFATPRLTTPGGSGGGYTWHASPRLLLSASCSGCCCFSSPEKCFSGLPGCRRAKETPKVVLFIPSPRRQWAASVLAVGVYVGRCFSLAPLLH